jgi:filamentous hemagglutinin
MRNAKRFMRTTTAYLAIGLIFTQPILAQVIVDTSAPQSNQATLSTTSNKVPLVNIAAPSTGGLSHNKFEAYSVDELNLILNNSTQTVDTLIS